MSVDYQRQFPNRLKVIRQSTGYTQRQVAKLLGHKTPALLSDWENEKSMPNATNLIKLCILYNKASQDLYPEYYQKVAERFNKL